MGGQGQQQQVTGAQQVESTKQHGQPAQASPTVGSTSNAASLPPVAGAAKYQGSVFGAFAAPRPGGEVLSEFVGKAEQEVAKVASRIDHVLAPDALVSTACAHLLTGFAEVELALDRSSPNADAVHPLMQRLDVAMGRLFLLARQHRVMMRESGLEDVFDREDRLRVREDISFGARAQRAEHYYDADFGSAKKHEGGTPTAATVSTDLRDGESAGEPLNRDELIQQIEGLSARMWGALDHAFEGASAAINEPDKPHNPGVLERLAELAVSVLIDRANIALGNVLGLIKIPAGTRVLAMGRAAVRESVGKDTAKALLAGFVKTTKTVGQKAAKIGVSEGLEYLNKPGARPSNGEVNREFNPDAISVSPKAIYLLHAHKHTTDAMTATSKAFISYGSTLKRLPVDTLREIHASFDDKTFADVTTSFRGLLIQEWINFVKLASDEGYQMRDEATRKRELGTTTATKLDGVLQPAGVLRIRVLLGKEGKARFADASLPGVSATVLDEVHRMKDSLATLGLHRRIELIPQTATDVGFGTFDVDQFGQIRGTDKIPKAGRAAIAAVVHPVREAVFTEQDVESGMLAIVNTLSVVPASVIKAVG